jgi:hypothetical protein
MASIMGALKSGAPMASMDLAKQKEMTVSNVKQRRPKDKSDDLPAALFVLIMSQKRFT